MLKLLRLCVYGMTATLLFSVVTGCGGENAAGYEEDFDPDHSHPTPVISDRVFETSERYAETFNDQGTVFFYQEHQGELDEEHNYLQIFVGEEMSSVQPEESELLEETDDFDIYDVAPSSQENNMIAANGELGEDGHYTGIEFAVYDGSKTNEEMVNALIDEVLPDLKEDIG
ncbi:hypothetical protein B0H94_11170 [Salsuginibacillus halophilus]|uniref:Lipoprotein n=1 Tax=Salsuginibacillus halophilus TaxID=517424 RepID=A0A2P8HAJ6_9BACI|nr:hypothetical protein [Salsuginibacillus halophilus]PSL43246.1 hypothetical protein B0H94_11170 [Salsuginibacillus halophilus]